MSVYLNQIQPSIQSSLLVSFRNFAREIREPRAYQLGVSEYKGVLNIIIGLGQILTCPCFLALKKNRIYQVHLETGKISLKQGVEDLSPALTVVTLAFAATVIVKNLGA